MACDGLVPFSTPNSRSALAALSAATPGARRQLRTLAEGAVLAHWLRSEKGFSGLPRAATDRGDDRGTGGPGRATIRRSCQAPELRETEFNALSSFPLTHCLFAACAVLVPLHFSSLPRRPGPGPDIRRLTYGVGAVEWTSCGLRDLAKSAFSRVRAVPIYLKVVKYKT